MTQASARYPFDGHFGWQGVEKVAYKPEGSDWADISRQVVIGRDHATGFHVRYFEILAGGYSSLEKHAHAHVVIGVRGQGLAVVGDQAWTLGFLDTVYVAPNTPHQFSNDGREPFGFLCIVDAERDRPQPLEPSELRQLLASAVAAHLHTEKRQMGRA